MKTSHAVLAATGAAAVGLVMCERHHRQRLALHAAEIHQTWITELITNAELRAVWTPSGGGVTDEEHLHAIVVNRMISMLSVRYRVGLLTKRALRIQAERLMDAEVGRQYWKRYGSTREAEAPDRIDRQVLDVLADAYEDTLDMAVSVG
ncbi:spore associated protein, SapC [Streptomyces sp. SID10853]|uniref:DUF6082 family protein n=1 Tax=Streptomyces sp. SID10853 TaxID=2706028 RepID=UPI0013C0CEF5|nr:DUF6082 family protein [Streptomyces sp. SID10853]NDZ77001.1 spore associated protein, SapC [Streptomyces sp. SID10853]